VSGNVKIDKPLLMLLRGGFDKFFIASSTGFCILRNQFNPFTSEIKYLMDYALFLNVNVGAGVVFESTMGQCRPLFWLSKTRATAIVAGSGNDGNIRNFFLETEAKPEKESKEDRGDDGYQQ